MWDLNEIDVEPLNVVPGGTGYSFLHLEIC